MAALTLAFGCAASEASAYVYWTSGNSGGSIGRAELDGTNATPSYIAGLNQPLGLTVDPNYIYWSELTANGSAGTIARATLSGTGVSESFAPSNWPGAIAADALHVYWVNSTSNSIGRANLDGTSVNQNFITGISDPQGVAVDGSHIYWANMGANSIGRASLDGSNVNQSYVPACEPASVAVDAAHIYWVNQCSGNGNIGRANIDGTAANGSFIALPSGGVHSIAVDAGHIYWAAGTAIDRASIDGTNVNSSFITGLSGVQQVAVDGLASSPSTSLLTPSQSSSYYGQPLTFTDTVRSASTSPHAPTGTVRFGIDGVDDGSPIALDAGGKATFSPTYPPDVGSTVTARYAGDVYFAGSSASVQPNIRAAGTATAVTSSANPQTPGTPVTFTATVTNTNSAVVPFGSVQFVVDGTPVLQPLPLDANGQAGIVAYNGMSTGDHVITAYYHDDTGATPDFLDSQGSLTEHITPASSGSGHSSFTFTQGSSTIVGDNIAVRPSVPPRPPAIPPARDASPVLIATAVTPVLHGVAHFTILCNCEGQLTLLATGPHASRAATRALGVKRFTLHGRASVGVRLTHAGLARLKHAKRLSALLSASLRQQTGVTVRKSARTTLVMRG